MRAITKLQLLRLKSDIASEHIAEHATANNKMLAITLKVETPGTSALLGRECLVELLNHRLWLFQRRIPEMDLVASELRHSWW
ncbi:hypothetical protein KDW_58310 [Dictyobacter vulcani]|uniref:Uncharacterized protein n=1 Tax=Dictyobacter vulcani TaxID=2607529 RepID=A0A5J4L028_9CHLR|nr:hypothetical protein [Dictyobacter vulcani]GER91669.1 hypothetical protein KDW_58310 [Dictyobacter vulcani]